MEPLLWAATVGLPVAPASFVVAGVLVEPGKSLK